MSKLLFANAQVQDDTWSLLADEQELPANGDLIVSTSRWAQERDALLQHSGRLGLSLENTFATRELAEDLKHFDLIALNFPSFTDGRAYSQARELREQLGYSGIIRACGDILQDQLFYMKRCGVDCFEFPSNLRPEDIAQAFSSFSAHYQPQLKDGIPLAGVFAGS